MTISPEEIAVIAGKLTEAQRRSLLCLPENGNPRYSFDRNEIPGLSGLRRKKLAEPRWSWSPRDHPWSLTPLGILVRAHLAAHLEKGNG